MSGNICESCANFIYDEEEETYICNMDLDEDEAVRLMSYPQSECPYFRADDEYAVVRHQL